MREVPIQGFEGFYTIREDGAVYSLHSNKYLKPKKTSKGYLTVTLQNAPKKAFPFVHRLIAIAFIPNPANLPYINHKDGVRDNNALDNLEWCNQAHNKIDSIQKRYSSGNLIINLSPKQMQEAVQLYKSGTNYAKLNEHFGIDCSAIYWGRFLSGERLSEISGITEDFRRKPTYSFPTIPEATVHKILDEYCTGGITQAALAVKYSVNVATVCHIVTGRTRPKAVSNWLVGKGLLDKFNDNTRDMQDVLLRLVSQKVMEG